jgi:hypothetical protein
MLSKTAQCPFHALFAAFKDFLKLWKDTDPDIPLLKQANAEYTKFAVTEERSPSSLLLPFDSCCNQA